MDGEPQNTTTLTYQYGATNNRLVKIGDVPVESDSAGNHTQDRADRQLVYNEQNRLVAIKIGGVLFAEYRYNALGQRTHKIHAQGTTTFLYGPDGQLLGEQQFDYQGNKIRDQYYIWLGQMPLGGVTITYDSQGTITGSTRFYLHSDHLNTPRLATDDSQQPVWQWTSDAFGVGSATGSLALNLRFPGQYYDGESGLHYNYFRDYDPQTGRYVKSDPIGLWGGLNTFGYAEGNPLTLSDPKGLAAAAAGLCFIPGVGWVGCGAAAAGAGAVGLVCYLTGSCQEFAKACKNAWAAASESNESSQSEQRPSKTPNEGEPGSKHVNPGSGQERWYGSDGKPVKDIDWDHDHGQGKPHVHDWDRDENGRPIRGPGRPFNPATDS